MLRNAVRRARLCAHACLALAGATLGAAAVAAPPVQTVPAVDLSRYVGKWYEIANFPMFFQRQCVGDTTAEYAANPDKTVSVTNRCRTKDGSIDSAHGTATVVEGSNNTKLEVSFFKPFKGDYWVIGLDPEYRWAVIGTPDRKYLWILSRSPQLPKDQLDLALKAASDQGYTFEELRYTPQQ
ncbi:hypothetical protein CEG14_02260 [Bordetella genomosp. 1]|uniref:Outer membrane lipoprotein Blc n=1 Tax=Bordetella genomosp. 1 TaxID=1395607 RepID=A0A261STX2_9BORD|nr:lipocalin family protein [Bordetella genomosp. 1]MDQ8033412.1 lipocalin family protein [Bordetella sp.]OZI40605.1 hypothetical protein CEG14_02260 [Bordetella genomosp. 1]OZI68797.1 hypothetical protein CAL27_04900 [Bordetella genomosp. 1]